jgi:hypothetical protein
LPFLELLEKKVMWGQQVHKENADQRAIKVIKVILVDRVHKESVESQEGQGMDMIAHLVSILAGLIMQIKVRKPIGWVQKEERMVG